MPWECRAMKEQREEPARRAANCINVALDRTPRPTTHSSAVRSAKRRGDLALVSASPCVFTRKKSRINYNKLVKLYERTK